MPNPRLVEYTPHDAPQNTGSPVTRYLAPWLIMDTGTGPDDGCSIRLTVRDAENPSTFAVVFAVESVDTINERWLAAETAVESEPEEEPT